MHVIHGDLLPRATSEEPAGSIGYYVAENATLTVYQQPPISSSLSILMIFLLGSVVGFSLFTWANDARSADRGLAMLRSPPLPEKPQHHYLVMPVYESRGPITSDAVIPANRKPAIVPSENRAAIDNSTHYSIEISKSEPVTTTDTITQAIALASVQNYKMAENTLLNQYRRGQVSPKLLYALGILYSKNRQWKKSVLSLRQACQKMQDDGLCYYNLAVGYDHLKKRSKALNAYESAMKKGAADSEWANIEALEKRIRELHEW